MRLYGIAVALFFTVSRCYAQEPGGAIIPWTTYEAEQMQTNGMIIGPGYDPYRVETESSGQQAVRLNSKDQFVAFTAGAPANSLVIRYSLPDSRDGKGLGTTLTIYMNGKLAGECTITSRYAWLYGKYPFSNDPAAGQPRHFYDEARIQNLSIAKGDVVRIQAGNNGEKDVASYCIIDMVDLEAIPPAIKTPYNALSVTDRAFGGNDTTNDYTDAFRKCIQQAAATAKTVWIPAGKFIITGDILLPSNVKIQGAGMWYTTLVGDEALYMNAARRVRMIGNGSNIHIAGFSILGALNYRSDREANDGITGSFGTSSTISDIWIEHTKVGMWIENSRWLIISNCRMRNTMADGINFCVGMKHSVIMNCTARGTGDDGFAIWPAVFKPQRYAPGFNTISHCTVQLPYLANGAAVYGGKNNAIWYCSFTDITQGSAILISTTFPTENKTSHNNFSGTTTIKACTIQTSGGFDHEWGWRGAVEICLDKRGISGLLINNVTVNRSLSSAVRVIARSADGEMVALKNAILKNVHIGKYGLGIKDSYGLFVSDDAHGALTIRQSAIPNTRKPVDFAIVQ